MRGTVVYKMTGSGNDFVMLDGRVTEPDRWPATRVAAICDRRTGVGADGLVILTPDAPGQGPDDVLELRRLPGRHVRQRGALQRAARGVPGAGRSRASCASCTDAGRGAGPVPTAPATRPRSSCRTSSCRRPVSGLETGRRRALAGLRHGRRPASGRPGGRHRADRSAGPRPGAPVRPAARARPAPTSTSWRRPRAAGEPLADPDLRARRRR